MIDLSRVGNRIAQLRNDLGLSQDQLAERLFVSRQAISAWELGKSAPSIDNVIELSRIFRVSFDDILCLNERPFFSTANVFEGHEREYVIRSVIEGTLKIDIPSLLFQCTGSERTRLLKAIKDERIECRYESIEDKLTNDEKLFMKKGGQ
jgi:transcriptional regulator with XRE-family HTH domain